MTQALQKPFRCYNPRCATHPSGRLGFDFWAEAPICPKCKVDGAQPRYAHLVVQLAVVHLDPPGGLVEGMGRGSPACNPDAKIGGQWLGTAVAEAVNCPACQATQEYRDAMTAAQPVLEHLRKWQERCRAVAEAEKVRREAEGAAAPEREG